MCNNQALSVVEDSRRNGCAFGSLARRFEARAEFCTAVSRERSVLIGKYQLVFVLCNFSGLDQNIRFP